MVLLVALALVAASCGSSSMSREAADALREDLGQLRAAVEQQDPQRARVALDELRAEARERADEGEISADRLAQIESAAAQVEGFLEELDAQPPPDPPPDPAPGEERGDEDAEDEEDEEPEPGEEVEDAGEGSEGDDGPGNADDGGPDGPGEGEGRGEEAEEGPTGNGAPGEDETETSRATSARLRRGVVSA